jgi:hypothetical protein
MHWWLPFAAHIPFLMPKKQQSEMPQPTPALYLVGQERAA